MADERAVNVGAVLIWNWLKNRGNRRYWVHPYIRKREENRYLENLIAELRADYEKFSNYTRMMPRTFDDLLELVKDKIEKKDTNYRRSIPAESRLFITLRYLATGATFQELHYEFRVGASTIGIIVKETCKVIWEVLQPHYMKNEYTSEEWEKIADRFEKIWQFPHCVGCIDGKHIRIKKPPKAGSMFYCYKNFHSIVLQAVVDADGYFLFVDVGDYGRSSDGGVFNESMFGKKLLNQELNLPKPRPFTSCPGLNIPYVFLADEAYRLHKNLMRPYSRRNITSDHYKIYNYRHSRARRIVECAFGILRARFRVFASEISINPETVDNIVLAACVLHNYIKRKQNVIEDNFLLGQSNSYLNISSTRVSNSRPTNEAMQIREAFKNYFSSSEGLRQVPWQIEYINK